MSKKPDIHKAGVIFIKDGKFLVTKPSDKEFFIAPGGSLEKGETAVQAAIREIQEELSLVLNEASLSDFGTFYAQAAGDEDKTIRMDVFIVHSWEGEPTPSNEIEEILWISSTPPATIKIGSIFEHEVLPRLKQQGFID